MGYITIIEKELERLKDRERKLIALEKWGVDGWEWYQSSLSEYFREKNIALEYENFIIELNDILSEADVSQPAGQGCGYAIEYNEATVIQRLKELVQNIKELEK